jgi:hypothetical protein
MLLQRVTQPHSIHRVGLQKVTSIMAKLFPLVALLLRQATERSRHGSRTKSFQLLRWRTRPRQHYYLSAVVLSSIHTGCLAWASG